MTDSSPAPRTPGRPGTPVWVKALAVAAAVIITVVVVAMLVLGGQHGPGQHTGSSQARPEASVPTWLT